MSVSDLLGKRKDRCLAIILSAKERDIDGYLPAPARAALRKLILDTVNDFYHFSLDLMEAETVVVNDLWLEKIDAIHGHVIRCQEPL